MEEIRYTSKERGGLERLRSMSAEEDDAGLVLSVGLSMAVSTQQAEQRQYSPGKTHPLQLDLLPMRPVARVAGSSPSPAAPFPWLLPQNSREEVTVAEAALGRGIDMNRAPPVDDVFRAEAMHGGGTLAVKRERERERGGALDFEMERDRTCDVSSRTSDEEEIGSTRKKLRLSKEQSALLEESFREHSTLNPKQKNALAKQLNLRPRQVEVWFQNRRARTKLKQTEVDCELLKRCCENLTEENRRLQKELQELRALKAAPPPCVIGGVGGGGHDYYMALPATTLTMCPSCERVATMDNNRTLPFSKPQLSPFAQQSAAC